MPQVKYTADGLPYYDATDQQTQPYFPQVSGPMLPAPGVPGTPSEGWNQGVRDTLHGMTIQPVQDAAKALAGGMTDAEAQDFAFGAAMGLLPMRRAMQGIRAYHGSPHDFDRFDMSKIGTGEGAQAYGHGLYFAENEGVAKQYRNLLSSVNDTVGGVPFNALDPLHKASKLIHDTGSRDAAVAEALKIGKEHPNPSAFKYWEDIANLIKNTENIPALNQYKGRMYEVNINAHPDQFLDWDKPLSKQPIRETVQQNILDKLRSASRLIDRKLGHDPVGQDIYSSLGSPFGKKALTGSSDGFSNKANSTNILRDAGIPGIKYLDQGSRAAGEGSRNYVVFDDKLIDIVRKYGLAAIAPLAAAMGMSADKLPIPKAQAPQL